ncbi:MAG: proton-conducting transporter membrane subunit [Rectinemataceae bacterium]|nr:proton-conducting transporter membrane subunit [Rectinemataceae bacterium]
MVSVWLVLTGVGIMAASGLPACLMSSTSSAGQRLTAVLFVAGSLCGFAGTALSFGGAVPPSLHLPWTLPLGQFSIAIDPLSGFFLLLVFAVPALGAVYGLGYWKQAEHRENGQRLGLAYGLLAAGMAMVVIARDAVLFLIVWEIMALAAWFAATAEDDKPEVREAGWIYLVATHIGTLILIGMFALWYKATGSFALDTAHSVGTETAGLIFMLAVAGFGFKAGLMPLHVWLPGAHANAPGHVSAVMSGVMLKMGIYGMMRMSGLLGACESWWGIVLLVAGSVTGLLAIAFAMGQRDMKRLLAYSSIENIGIIVMGMGLALLGRALERPDLVLLGMGGALLHVWNHGLFKSLMFFNAGAIMHASGTRDIELMGGLGKKMPTTALLFIIGAVAISALPPLNGFASEWLIYLGLFRTLDSSSVSGLALAGIAAVALAMTGALAAATFVKLYGTVFLGSPRSAATDHAHDPEASMKIPMALLAASCIAIGIFPMLVTPLLERALHAWMPSVDATMRIAYLAPQSWITFVGAGLLAIIAILALWRRLSGRKKTVTAGVTWDCGYAKPTARMQYTGTSFGQNIVRLFSFALWPATSLAEPLEGPRLHFPGKAGFETAVPDTVLDRLVLPAANVAGRISPMAFIFQQGQTYLYVLYILVITMALFIFGGTGAGL